MITDYHRRILEAGSDPRVRRDARILLSALVWFYDDFYDGPECAVPEWVQDAREALADALTDIRDVRWRYEVVERTLDEWRAS